MRGWWRALAQAAQRSRGYPIPVGAQGQLGWSPGQTCMVSNSVVSSPACGRRLELDDL